MNVTNHPDADMLDPESLVEEPAESVESASAVAARRAETDRARQLAERYRLDFLDMNEFRIDQELFRSIPADLMLRYGFVPSRREGKAIVIVVSDPTDLPMIDELQRAARHAGQGDGRREDRHRVDAEEERKLAARARRGDRGVPDPGAASEDENGDENLTVERLTSDRQPDHPAGATRTIFTAIQRRASDIHIETQDDAVYVKYRIDGVLQPAMRPIAKRFHSSIISRIKVMAELDIAEKRVPQDGRFKLKVPGKTIDFRVSVMPSVHGEDAVIRILDKQSISEQFTELRLDILGFPEQELKRFRKYIREPYGMVLVTGPTGSGKTTTLYAALAEIKTIEDKIITIEDPVEYQLQGHHADSDQREEGADLRARAALDPAPRPGQDHGRRDPRPGDGADRHPVGADRPPGVHDGPRQQRLRRARPLPEHGRRALPVHLGAQLRHGAAPGAHDLRGVQARPGTNPERRSSSRRSSRRSPTRTRSTRAPAASSAAAPASRAAWRSASCST